jgi:alanine racemase
MRVGLRDVAERAGVSEATVSRVVNNRSGVADQTRSTVLRVLADLGYEGPLLRRTSKAGLVGLIVPELDNPIFPALAQAIETRLAGQGYVAVLCCATREGVQESEYVEMLLERNVAGIVVVSGMHADTNADDGLYQSLVAQGRPLVLVNGYTSGVDAPFVSCDDVHAVRLAVAHLVSLGHRRLALVTGPRRYVPVQRKTAAFEHAADRHGVSHDAQVVETVFSVEGGHLAARKVIDAGATGIVAASDLMALGAIRAVRDDGCHVPEDVSVVGFDDTPLMAFTDPPLTTVRQPVAAMADHAIRILMDLISGVPIPREEYLVRPELVVRGSTAAVPNRQVTPGERASSSVHDGRR